MNCELSNKANDYFNNDDIYKCHLYFILIKKLCNFTNVTALMLRKKMTNNFLHQNVYAKKQEFSVYGHNFFLFNQHR